MPRTEQNFANHLRFLPPWHFFAFPALLVNAVVALVALVRAPSLTTGWLFIVALALAIAVFTGRLMTLKNQDRIIRLEERLRLATVLGEDLRPSIPKLRTRQRIALRFAPDDELPDLVRRCLAGEFESPKDIKKAIGSWRADHHRV